MTLTCGSALSVRGGGARATRAERGGSWAARWAGVRDGVGGRENGPAHVLWAAGAGEGESDRGLGRETELGWVCFRDGLGFQAGLKC